MRRLFWFTLGVVVGAGAVWQSLKRPASAGPAATGAASVLHHAGRGFGQIAAKATVFVREFLVARREAEADLRREIGLES